MKLELVTCDLCSQFEFVLVLLHSGPFEGFSLYCLYSKKANHFNYPASK